MGALWRIRAHARQELWSCGGRANSRLLTVNSFEQWKQQQVMSEAACACLLCPTPAPEAWHPASWRHLPTRRPPKAYATATVEAAAACAFIICTTRNFSLSSHHCPAVQHGGSPAPSAEAKGVGTAIVLGQEIIHRQPPSYFQEER